MATAQRYGLAFGLGKKSKLGLNQAFNTRIGEFSERFAEILGAPVVISSDGLSGTLILNESTACFDVAVALQEAAWPAPLQHALVSAPPAGADRGGWWLRWYSTAAPSPGPAPAPVGEARREWPGGVHSVTVWTSRNASELVRNGTKHGIKRC